MLGLGLWLPAQWLVGQSLIGQWLPAKLSALLLNLAAHHDDIVDPDFLAWLKSQLDHLVTFEPWVLVIILTLVVLAIPAGIVGFYLYQQRRMNYF